MLPSEYACCPDITVPACTIPRRVQGRTVCCRRIAADGRGRRLSRAVVVVVAYHASSQRARLLCLSSCFRPSQDQGRSSTSTRRRCGVPSSRAAACARGSTAWSTTWFTRCCSPTRQTRYNGPVVYARCAAVFWFRCFLSIWTRESPRKSDRCLDGLGLASTICGAAESSWGGPCLPRQ